jgi:cytochrome P450
MLKDPRIGPPERPGSGEPLWSCFARWLINLDGERHASVRRMFSGIFTPRRVENYRESISRKANSLLDAVQDQGRMDLVSDFARPLPFAIICDVLGVSEDDRPWLAEHMLAMETGFARQHDSTFVAAAGQATDEMCAYFVDLLDRRTADPRDDLISQLAVASDDPEYRADSVANCVFFVEAGHVTTTSLLTGGTLLLLRNPEALDRLTTDPALMPTAVDEMLRLVTPLSVVPRRAREDIQVAGYSLPAGQVRLLFPAGANRDPAVFPDPTTLTIDRSPNPHLAFAAGAHYCLGAPLARLHGEVAIGLLLRRLPGLHLDGEPTWLGSIPVREPLSAPIAWGPQNPG